MKRFFTSDWHLNSALINEYAHRPVADAKLAAQGLVDMCNKFAGPEDTVIHVGDFILEGYDRHGKEEDCAKDMPKQDAWMKQIKAKFFCIQGNHDNGHNGESAAKCLLLDLNQNYKNVTVGHYPSCSQVIKKSRSGRTVFTKHSVDGYQGLYGSHKKIHIHLCGHVHDKWLIMFDSEHCVLNINVGVDVWEQKLVRDAEITSLLDYFRANLWTKIANDGSRWSNFSMSRQEFEKFKLAHSAEVKAQRQVRKAEKHKAKGLSAEECERRKIEAMKKKGLI